MNKIIEFKNLIKRYKKTLALDELTFSINEGSCTALIGNNGSGKTTTINVIGNITNYTNGEYFYKNKVVTPRYVSFKNELGMILSQPYYIEDFNTIEYWKFVAKYQKVPKTEIDLRISELMDILDLQDDKSVKIKDLSSGNQMKVTIGSSLIHNPEVLLLDEPFINLDIQTIKIFMDLLKSFKYRKTIFITSHNLDLVAELCDNFFIIDKGKIVKELEKKGNINIENLKQQVKDILVHHRHNLKASWLFK